MEPKLFRKTNRARTSRAEAWVYTILAYAYTIEA